MMRRNRSGNTTQKAEYEQIDEHVRAILAEYRSKLRQNNVFMTPNIPQTTLDHATSSYARLEEDEKVLIVIDMSHPGNAADGIVLTDKALHMKSPQGQHICFHLTSVRSIHSQGKNLFINNLSTIAIPDNLKKTIRLFPEVVKKIISQTEGSQTLRFKKHEKPGQAAQRVQKVADIRQQVRRPLIILIILVCIGYVWWRRPSPPPPESEIGAIVTEFMSQEALWQRFYFLSKQDYTCESGSDFQVEKIEDRNNVKEFKIFPGRSKYLVTLANTGTCTNTTRKKERWRFKVETDYLLIEHPPVFFPQDAKGKWGALPLKYYYKPEVLKKVNSLEEAIMEKVGEDPGNKPLEHFFVFLLFTGEMEENDSGVSSWRENETYVNRIYFGFGQPGRWYLQ